MISIDLSFTGNPSSTYLALILFQKHKTLSLDDKFSRFVAIVDSRYLGRVLKKPYQSPELRKYNDLRELPAHLKSAAQEILLEVGALTTIMDRERRLVSVSEAFARTLGYRTMELIGRPIDDFTVPNTIDIEFVFNAFFKLGEMDGIWIFQHRDGRKVVAHYRARLNNDHSYTDIKPLLVA